MNLPIFSIINTSAVFVLAFLSTFAVQPSKKVTFLGVSASTLPQKMSEQMDLPAGAHLSVDQVSPNSPAEQAGLRLYDVLLQLDDQILVNSSQLKALVRMKKPGDLITLKLLRKGEPKTLDVTLSETDIPIIPRRNSRSFGDLDDFFSTSRPRDFESLLPGLDPDLQDLLKRHMSTIPSISPFESPKDTPIDPENPLHGSQNQDIQTFSFSSQENFIVMSDEKGKLEFSQKDGKKYLKFQNSKGEVLYDGPVDSQEQRKNLPEFLRKKLQKIDPLN